MYYHPQFLEPCLPATGHAALGIGPGLGPGDIARPAGRATSWIVFPNPGGVDAGPRHLVMTFNTSQGTDMFVVPDAMNIVRTGPPAITSLTQNSDGSVTVAAAGLTPG
jgi:hypothetical protein